MDKQDLRSKFRSQIAALFYSTDEVYNIRPSARNAILIAPIVIVLVEAVLLINPSTRDFGLWLLLENHPVELLTFAFLFAGGVIGLALALKTRRYGEDGIVYGFYLLFSIALIVIAMEEVAWGQWFFGFETPEAFAPLNRQGETTIHNIAGLHGHSEILRLAFGLGGLVGIWLLFFPAFRKIAAPAILLPWFLIIAVHASIDVYNDFTAIEKRFDYAMQRTAELIEFLIAISAFLYLFLNSRMFSAQAGNSYSQGSMHK